MISWKSILAPTGIALGIAVGVVVAPLFEHYFGRDLGVLFFFGSVFFHLLVAISISKRLERLPPRRK